jgi:hypothetical protein
MTKQEVVGILLLSPIYFRLPPISRKQVVNDLHCILSAEEAAIELSNNSRKESDDGNKRHINQ